LRIDRTLFASYASILPWLYETRPQAPFRKIVIDLRTYLAGAKSHGTVTNALGVCVVCEFVPADELLAEAGNLAWTGSIIRHALACISDKLGWTSDELIQYVTRREQRGFLDVFTFERLTQVDPTSGSTFTPWFSAAPGRNAIGVRVRSWTGERDVLIAEDDEPIWLPEAFPLRSSAIRTRTREYVLLDGRRRVLASVDIPS